MLEYDDGRGRDFEPPAHVQKDKVAVLGARYNQEPPSRVPEGRLREASNHPTLERLALSPQCGFATSVIGNVVTVEDERRKLRAIVEAAGRVWGGA